MKLGKLFVITAPSGAGKTTLVQGVLERINDRTMLDRVITYTTRDARAHEEPGVDYHFVDQAVFLEMVERGEFLEWSTAYGHYYGSPYSVLDLLQNGLSYIMVVDAAGVHALQVKNISAIYVKITVSSHELLRERLLVRAQISQESKEIIDSRVKLVDQELAALENITFNYVLINEHLKVALDRLEELIRMELGGVGEADFGAKSSNNTIF